MKNRLVYLFLCIFFIFTFIIFYRGLNNSNLYTPNTNIKLIPEFKSYTLNKKQSLNSKNFCSIIANVLMITNAIQNTLK